jgi:hypothetical protein
MLGSGLDARFTNSLYKDNAVESKEVENQMV